MNEADESDERVYCMSCGDEMPESVAQWWLTADGYFCTGECAQIGSRT